MKFKPGDRVWAWGQKATVVAETLLHTVAIKYDGAGANELMPSVVFRDELKPIKKKKRKVRLGRTFWIWGGPKHDEVKTVKPKVGLEDWIEVRQVLK